jgi:translation initiation factor 2 subunit 1
MRKTGMPERDELVICRITKLHPNSAFAILVEYDKTGMIHVSEVAKRWVRDIREFVKENQYVVCRVMKVEGDHIFLSIKRVYKEQANSKLNEFKRERKAEKMFELAGKELGMDLNKSYDEIGYKLQDEFGSLSKALEFAMNDPELLKNKGIPEDWIKALSAIAEKNYVEKIYEVKANLKLISYEPDGVKVIRNALSEAETGGFDVKYISAPKYVIMGKGKKHKAVEAKVSKVAESVVKKVRQSNGSGEFKIVEG